jgi:hypothetical protein
MQSLLYAFPSLMCDAMVDAMQDLLAHKDVNLAPVDLSVSYILSSMSGLDEGEGTRKGQSEVDHSGSKIDSFATLCFSNFPMSRSSRDDLTSGVADSSEKHTVPNGPHFNFLVMSSQSCKGAMADAYANRRRNQRAIDTFVDCLRDPDSQDAPQPISAVEVDVVNNRDKFHSKLPLQVFALTLCCLDLFSLNGLVGLLVCL